MTVQVPKVIVVEEEVAAPVTEITGQVPAEGEAEAAAEGKEGEKGDKGRQGDKGDKGDKKEAAADKKEAGKKE